jgi:hypothetical protein
MDNIWKKIKKTYYKAYKDLQNLSNYSDYSTYPAITHQCFSNCVAMLCHDDITLEIYIRNKYLLKLMKISGGPTVREHYCMWKAFGRGEAKRTMDNKQEITQFYIDANYKPPGTWEYKEAFNFCLEHVFAEINSNHKLISTIEECFDDPLEDIQALNKLS